MMFAGHRVEDIQDRPDGLLFELLDNVEAQGTILVRENSRINFLFCSQPFQRKRVDEDFETEYQEAGKNHSCALFSYEDLEDGKLVLKGDSISGLTVYRGWMMKPELYRQFYELLEAKDIILINSPFEYEKYHTLPGWYPDFADDTIESVWETKGSVEDALKAAIGREGSYTVKDYVKSRKHEWYDACYIENIANKENASRIIGNFIERQDDDLVGGIVLRKFEKLKHIGFHESSGMPISEEYRVFILSGRVLCVADYWGNAEKVNLSPEEMQWIDSLAVRVKSNFVTMDIARKEDGNLIIMEFGDGQVSGLQQIKPEYFYAQFDE